MLALNLKPLQKEVLGLYLSESEGANFWLSVLSDLQNRGVEDIPDSLRGRADRLPGGNKQHLSADRGSCV